jgi:hypothetical protein
VPTSIAFLKLRRFNVGFKFAAVFIGSSMPILAIMAGIVNLARENLDQLRLHRLKAAYHQAMGSLGDIRTRRLGPVIPPKTFKGVLAGIGVRQVRM